MIKIVCSAILVMALSACGNNTECTGVEPDGDIETLRPCPDGWENGQWKSIQEDEFEYLESDNKPDKTPKRSKKKVKL